MAVGFISRKDLVLTMSLSLGYLLLSYLLIGFHSEQVFLVCLFNGMYYASRVTRKFILGFSVFIVYWIIFDYMKAFPNYRFAPVHTQSLYDAEKSLFGIVQNGIRMTPNEYWLQHPNTVLDVLSGFFYLCWIPVPLAFGAFLFWKNRQMFLHFAFTFFFVNLIGWLGYYTYPAAPPWYVHLHGFAFDPATPGNVAGLARFDQYFGVRIFSSLYAKSSNVFAAMPSLHSAYPAIVLYYSIRSRLGLMSVLFALITAGIWFAAVYTSHHYVLDVLAGIACTIVGIGLYRGVLLRQKRIHTGISSFYERIR